MNKKKWLAILILIIALFGISTGIYIILTKQDKNTLTILEKQWIEDNKNKIIDLGMVNGIPVFDYEGEGLLFNFITDIEKDTGLEFNKISYNLNAKVPSEYAFTYTDTLDKNDILIYQDNYVILAKDNHKYNRLKDLPTMVIGVLESNLQTANYYLKENKNISFKSYQNENEMLTEIRKENSSIQGIILPKTAYMKEMSGENKLHIIYQITEMNKNLVFHLGDTKKLNTIIRKYYKKWYREKYQDTYNTYFSDSYFLFNNIYEESAVNFRSKRYQYGFIELAPYDDIIDSHLVGMNNEIMKHFSKLADIEISYKQYSSTEKLLKDFNENKIDFFMNTTTQNKYQMDVYNTVSIYNEEAVVLSHQSHNITVQSLASLRNQTILTLKDSKIEAMLKEYELEVKTYHNINDLMQHMNKDSIIVLDQNTYHIYQNSNFKKYKIDYTFDINSDYNYVVRYVQENKIFASYYDFYLSFINEKQYQNMIEPNMFVEKVKHTLQIILALLGAIFILIVGSLILWKKSHKTKKKKMTTMSKENKLKYIDMLTSLKNRNYLNDNIQKWDDSEIYPQAIIIVDLNNVAYINDNYGHEEGDTIIREAANILIKNQIENSEIMRTNGNEFLIYMVEYEEKQVVTYIRKLHKEFKDLPHGFGAAIGYSMITDAIKTLDDAINEATLDMRNNKEETNN